MTTFYDLVLKECTAILGDHAQKFLDRQISGHLNKKPEELVRADQKALSQWLKISVSLIDREKGALLSKKVLEL